MVKYLARQHCSVLQHTLNLLVGMAGADQPSLSLTSCQEEPDSSQSQILPCVKLRWTCCGAGWRMPCRL